MKDFKKIGYILLLLVLILVGYGFFMIPKNKAFVNYEVVECEKGDTLGLLYSFKNKLSFENGVLKLPSQKYLDQCNYCSVNIIDKDLNYLKDSIGYGEDVVQPFFDLLTQRKFEISPLDSVVFQPKEIMEAILFGERALIYANLSKGNRIFFLALGRFWLNNASTTLTAISTHSPGIKYDENFKNLIDRCGQNKYQVELSFTNGEKFINYLVEKRYAYIVNRIWIGTPAVFKVIIFLFLLITLYAYYLLVRKMYTLIKNKIS